MYYKLQSTIDGMRNEILAVKDFLVKTFGFSKMYNELIE